MIKKLLISCVLAIAASSASAIGDAALDSLMERISPGLSSKVVMQLTPADKNYFRIDSTHGKVRITADNRVSAATGLHWYLKQIAGVHLSWDCMTPALPDTLPLPHTSITRTTDIRFRYYLNYCTHSYSMAFWDKQRWQREIDWMALHGINAPLAMTGMDAVWDATLRRLGYPEEKIDSFIAAPAYQAWWLMNNLEGEGAHMDRPQLQRQANLQRFILSAMRRLDIEPILPGYSGMVPHDARSVLGLEVADPGEWCGYRRPAFLTPTDSAFSSIARTYYEELTRLYGPAKYYSMDPFHEGGNTEGVDLGAAARAIAHAMEEASPGSVWVIQGWQENPRAELLDAVDSSKMIVLDLHAETAPQWSSRGHLGHPWAWCMLLNFGGNVGLHGKMAHVMESFHAAVNSPVPPVGIGLTMEGIDNNPVMYELVSELPWMDGSCDWKEWLQRFVSYRYGNRHSESAKAAWQLLAQSIYGAGGANRQQGTTESLFCARPSDNPANASTWANAEPYYKSTDVLDAAALLAAAAPELASNPHYQYDLVDITRQAVAEAGRLEAARFSEAATNGDSAAYRHASTRFLNLIMLQDSLLSTTSDFRLGSWTEAARKAAASPQMTEEMERDARRLITTWGSRNASEQGKLHDYAHREWQGLLADFYYPRWKCWFETRLSNWGRPTPSIDFYSMEHKWAEEAGRYSSRPSGDPVATALRTIHALLPYTSASTASAP